MSGLYGIFKKLAESFIVDKSINQLYDKEYHGILKLPNGKYAFSQYMGPGTRLDIRVPRGDKGLTPIDEASMGHDIRYRLALKGENKQEVQDAIRNADNIFNNVIDRLRKEGKENELNLKQAELIKVKVFLEGNKVLRDYILNFNSRKTDSVDSPELDAMYEKELRRLEQKGYGEDIESQYGEGVITDISKWVMPNATQTFKTLGLGNEMSNHYTGGFGFNSIPSTPKF